MASGKRDDDDTGISGSRKKSWRELDASRGKSKHGSRSDDQRTEKLQQSASYEKYKKAADSLFGTAELPPGLAEKFDPEGKRKELKGELNKISDAPNRKAWAELVVAFVEKNGMPEDAFFLDSFLDHPKDRLVDKALAKLELLQSEGKLLKAKAPRSLEQRLKSLEMTSLDSEIQTRAKVLRTVLF
jgi:hypothetical protein